jgi:hypothetical protein
MAANTGVSEVSKSAKLQASKPLLSLNPAPLAFFLHIVPLQ